MRATSQIVSILIILGILVALSIALSEYIYSLLSQQTPNTVDLTVTVTSVRLESSTLYIRGTITPIGNERIIITGIETYKSSSIVSATSTDIYVTAPMDPGKVYEFTLVLYGVNGVSEGDRLVLLIYWSTSSHDNSGVEKIDIIIPHNG